MPLLPWVKKPKCLGTDYFHKNEYFGRCQSNTLHTQNEIQTDIFNLVYRLCALTIKYNNWHSNQQFHLTGITITFFPSLKINIFVDTTFNFDKFFIWNNQNVYSVWTKHAEKDTRCEMYIINSYWCNMIMSTFALDIAVFCIRFSTWTIEHISILQGTTL